MTHKAQSLRCLRACRARKKKRRLAGRIARAVQRAERLKLNGECFATRRTLALERLQIET